MPPIATTRLSWCGHWLLKKIKNVHVQNVELEIHDKDVKPTFFKDATQGRAVGVEHGKPHLASWVAYFLQNGMYVL